MAKAHAFLDPTAKELWRALRSERWRQPSASDAPRSPAGIASCVSWLSTVLRSEVTSRSSGSDPPTV
jgi:hypothetical protein